jgi:hypothetical protein
LAEMCAKQYVQNHFTPLRLFFCLVARNMDR